MPELSTDNLVKFALALLAAGGLSFGGFSTNEAATCRDLLQDQAVVCKDTIEAVATQYSDALETVREIVRETR